MRYLPAFFFFFFSSRRRHTRSLCDRSSDVCSSDLSQAVGVGVEAREHRAPEGWAEGRSEERRVGKSVDLGGRRIIKKKKKKKKKVKKIKKIKKKKKKQKHKKITTR